MTIIPKKKPKPEPLEHEKDIEAMLEAARQGNLPAFKELIEKGVDPNCCNEAKSTPLFLAAHWGHIEIVRFILQLKIRLDKETDNSSEGNTRSYKTIDIDVQDCNGETALSIAIISRRSDIARLILYAGADHRIYALNQRTPLQFAADIGFVRLIKALVNVIDNEDELNIPNVYGLTPLHIAAREGRDPAVRELIKAGADVNARSLFFGQTPIHVAVRRAYMEITQRLINGDADIESLDLDGNTPLCVAAENGFPWIIKTLTAAGAKVNLQEVPIERQPFYQAISNFFDEKENEKHNITKIKNYKASILLLLKAGAEVDFSHNLTKKYFIAEELNNLSNLPDMNFEEWTSCMMKLMSILEEKEFDEQLIQNISENLESSINKEYKWVIEKKKEISVAKKENVRLDSIKEYENRIKVFESIYFKIINIEKPHYKYTCEIHDKLICFLKLNMEWTGKKHKAFLSAKSIWEIQEENSNIPDSDDDLEKKSSRSSLEEKLLKHRQKYSKLFLVTNDDENPSLENENTENTQNNHQVHSYPCAEEKIKLDLLGTTES